MLTSDDRLEMLQAAGPDLRRIPRHPTLHQGEAFDRGRYACAETCRSGNSSRTSANADIDGLAGAGHQAHLDRESRSQAAAAGDAEFDAAAPAARGRIRRPGC